MLNLRNIILLLVIINVEVVIKTSAFYYPLKRYLSNVYLSREKPFPIEPSQSTHLQDLKLLNVSTMSTLASTLPPNSSDFNVCYDDRTEPTEKEGMMESFGNFLYQSGSTVSKLWHCIIDKYEIPPAKDINFYLYTRKNNVIPENMTIDPIMLTEFARNKRKILNMRTKQRNNGDVKFEPLALIQGFPHFKHFNVLSPTKILIHGYIQDCEDNRIKNIKRAYLRKYDYNVIMVDWSKLATSPCYWTASKHAKYVGYYLGQLLNQLQICGAQLNSFHIIGFSLGAHAAGFISTALNTSRVGRITGLDPALPLFDDPNPSTGLDPGDAHFVDVIHTDGGFFGLSTSIGHADFYPNGGFKQPGCEKLGMLSHFAHIGIMEYKKSNAILVIGLFCSHGRAAIYFAESIVSETGFYSVACPSWEDYLLKKCNLTDRQKPVLMGEPCTCSANGSYFLKTGRKKPFAIKW